MGIKQYTVCVAWYNVIIHVRGYAREYACELTARECPFSAVSLHGFSGRNGHLSNSTLW